MPAIPSKRNEAPVRCPDWIYPNRNVVERLWARLKEWLAVAARCGFICRTSRKEPGRFRLDPSHHTPGPNRCPFSTLAAKGGVLRALERAQQVRLEAVGRPDPLYGAQRDPDGRGHGRAGSVRDLARGGSV